jgi:FHS family Na+ dependent glucose MFS transporter 1
MLPVVAFLARQPSPAIQAGSKDGQAGAVNVGLVVLIMLFFFLNVGAEASFGGWIFTYAKALSLGTEVTAAYLTSAFWGALTVGRLLAIPIAARVRPRWILLGDILGCLASLSVILFWQASYAAVWLGALGMGLFMASVFPTTMTFAELHLPISGRITGWFFVGASAGGMFFPWLIGQLFEPIGPPAAMLIILSAMALALVNFAVLVLYIARGFGEQKKEAKPV